MGTAQSQAQGDGFFEVAGHLDGSYLADVRRDIDDAGDPRWVKEPRLIERLCELPRRSGIMRIWSRCRYRTLALLSPQQRRESGAPASAGMSAGTRRFRLYRHQPAGAAGVAFLRADHRSTGRRCVPGGGPCGWYGVAAQMGMSVVTSNVQRFPEQPPACTRAPFAASR